MGKITLRHLSIIILVFALLSFFMGNIIGTYVLYLSAVIFHLGAEIIDALKNKK